MNASQQYHFDFKSFFIVYRYFACYYFSGLASVNFAFSKTSQDMNIKSANTILYCRKWEETVAFYKEQLGPAPIKDHIWGARVIHIHDPEGHRLEFWSSGMEV